MLVVLFIWVVFMDFVGVFTFIKVLEIPWHKHLNAYLISFLFCLDLKFGIWDTFAQMKQSSCWDNSVRILIDHCLMSLNSILSFSFPIVMYHDMSTTRSKSNYSSLKKPCLHTLAFSLGPNFYLTSCYGKHLAITYLLIFLHCDTLFMTFINVVIRFFLMVTSFIFNMTIGDISNCFLFWLWTRYTTTQVIYYNIWKTLSMTFNSVLWIPVITPTIKNRTFLTVFFSWYWKHYNMIAFR